MRALNNTEAHEPARQKTSDKKPFCHVVCGRISGQAVMGGQRGSCPESMFGDPHPGPHFVLWTKNSISVFSNGRFVCLSVLSVC